MSEAGSSAKAPIRAERDLLEEVVGQSRAHAEQLSEIQRWIKNIAPVAAMFEFLVGRATTGTGPKTLAELVKQGEQQKSDRSDAREIDERKEDD